MTSTGRTTKIQTLLKVQDLTKSFGGVRAVNHVNLVVDDGELRCLIGPNGAGKSTLFSLLSGLQKPDEGHIYFKGQEITSIPPFRRVRRGICQKFQTTRVYRGLSLRENLFIAKQVSNESSGKNGRLSWALETLGLESENESRAGELPHSHQQWLEICMALATEPDLLLLDEPTAGMTPEEAALTADFVINLNAQGMTVIVVEHDMAFVRQIAQFVTVLHYGSIFAEGTLSQIESNSDVRRIYLGEQ